MESYYLCILDFEATCCDKEEFPRNHMEIIEFPSVLYKITGKTSEFVSEFHQYVKPTIHPVLTNFCTDLTGIQQETVDKADTIDIVYKSHIKWLNLNVKTGSNVYICTCGHWDLKTMLPHEIRNKKLSTHKYYSIYINVKDEYEYFYKRKTKSMLDMLSHLNIKLEGRHHSGIDDTKNISKILMKIILDGHDDFKINSIN